MGMRETFTEELVRLAEKDERICLLDADLRVGHGTKSFYDSFPERSFNVGVAEANMVGIAAGLSAGGKIPFAETFGCFAARRAFDQFFLSANYAGLNVKLVGSDPGVTAAYNGGTHMPFEDIAMMRAVPELTIVSPSDPYSLSQLMEPIAKKDGCVYIRMPRKAEQKIYKGTEKIELGKANVIKDGTDMVIAFTGFVMAPEALKTAELLEKQGINAAVIDFHTIKPLDTQMLDAWAEKVGCFVTMENHQIAGGFGGAVSEYLSLTKPVNVLRIGIEDRFGQVGTMDYLKKDFGLTAEQMSAKIYDYFKK